MVVVKGREVLKLRGASSQSTNRIRASRESLNKHARRVTSLILRQFKTIPNSHMLSMGDVRIRPRECACSDVVRDALSLSSWFSSTFPPYFPSK